MTDQLPTAHPTSTAPKAVETTLAVSKKVTDPNDLTTAYDLWAINETPILIKRRHDVHSATFRLTQARFARRRCGRHESMLQRGLLPLLRLQRHVPEGVYSLQVLVMMHLQTKREL